jgi:hypothetical protein
MYGERVSKGFYSEGVAILNLSYNFFRNYYYSGVSVGANLKGAFRLMPDYSDSDDLGNNSGTLIPGSGMEQSTAMLMGDLGILTRFDMLKFYRSRDRNASAALVFRNLGPPAMEDALPSSVTAAISYKPLRPLLISVDFSVPMNFSDFSLSEKPCLALGFSGEITSFLSMRTGIMAKAGSVRITVGSAVYLQKIAVDINYTLDLLTQFQPLNRVSIGVRLDLGDQGRKALGDRVDELYLSGLDAYAGGELSAARDFWEEALGLDPGFAPAREGLNLINRSLGVEERIRDMERLYF